MKKKYVFKAVTQVVSVFVVECENQEQAEWIAQEIGTPQRSRQDEMLTTYQDDIWMLDARDASYQNIGGVYNASGALIRHFNPYEDGYNFENPN